MMLSTLDTYISKSDILANLINKAVLLWPWYSTLSSLKAFEFSEGIAFLKGLKSDLKLKTSKVTQYATRRKLQTQVKRSRAFTNDSSELVLVIKY